MPKSFEDESLADFAYFSALFDLYRGCLTLTEQNALEAYFGGGLEQSEIAENEKISRQSVHKTFSSAKAKLIELESQIGYYGKKFIISAELENALQSLKTKNFNQVASILENLKKEL